MELKPCPFCGREPRESERAGSLREGGNFVVFIACFCGGYSARAHQFAVAETLDEAKQKCARQWNTRA